VLWWRRIVLDIPARVDKVPLCAHWLTCCIPVLHYIRGGGSSVSAVCRLLLLLLLERGKIREMNNIEARA